MLNQFHARLAATSFTFATLFGCSGADVESAQKDPAESESDDLFGKKAPEKELLPYLGKYKHKSGCPEVPTPYITFDKASVALTLHYGDGAKTTDGRELDSDVVWFAFEQINKGSQKFNDDMFTYQYDRAKLKGNILTHEHRKCAGIVVLQCSKWRLTSKIEFLQSGIRVSDFDATTPDHHEYKTRVCEYSR